MENNFKWVSGNWSDEVESRYLVEDVSPMMTSCVYGKETLIFLNSERFLDQVILTS
jgi:hypothetical protein